ncbi:hypothetical protein B0H13DRAFT_1970013 [Mycena leptocephala]|nr:hypothetical protein B0H13DRAFT_1970013 [Mycena leptocephala]
MRTPPPLAVPLVAKTLLPFAISLGLLRVRMYRLRRRMHGTRGVFVRLHLHLRRSPSCASSTRPSRGVGCGSRRRRPHGLHNGLGKPSCARILTGA